MKYMDGLKRFKDKGINMIIGGDSTPFKPPENYSVKATCPNCGVAREYVFPYGTAVSSKQINCGNCKKNVTLEL